MTISVRWFIKAVSIGRSAGRRKGLMAQSGHDAHVFAPYGEEAVDQGFNPEGHNALSRPRRNSAGAPARCRRTPRRKYGDNKDPRRNRALCQGLGQRPPCDPDCTAGRSRPTAGTTRRWRSPRPACARSPTTAAASAVRTSLGRLRLRHARRRSRRGDRGDRRDGRGARRLLDGRRRGRPLHVAARRQGRRAGRRWSPRSCPTCCKTDDNPDGVAAGDLRRDDRRA